MLVIIIVFSLLFTTVQLQVEEFPNTGFKTTTGSTPPPGSIETIHSMGGRTAAATNSGSYMLNVPEYDWQHGCSPTATGMIFGYYDLNFGTDLLGGGDPEIQNEVNEYIASIEHYNDYSLPMDSGASGVLDDKSTTGGAHTPDNCIADFYETSWSSEDLTYGATRTNRYVPEIIEFSNWRGYTLNNCEKIYWDDGIDFELIKNEIDAGRPILASVDSTGNDATPDHAITIFAWNDNYNPPLIGIKTTWASNPVKWIEVRPLSEDYSWGIHSIVLIEYDFSPPPVCGDGTCDTGETPESCPEDCGPEPPVCGNGICEEGETILNCYDDCYVAPFCGDGICNNDETWQTCGDCINFPPIATDDFYITQENTLCIMSVIDNDNDGDLLTLESYTTPLHGTASQVNNKIHYTPHNNYVGNDEFTYTITDTDLQDTATVYITVTNVPHPVVCYKCDGGTLDSDVFDDTCPNGWSDTPEYCGTPISAGADVDTIVLVSSISGVAIIVLLISLLQFAWWKKLIINIFALIIFLVFIIIYLWM